MKLSTLAFNLSIPSRAQQTWPLISGSFLSMAVIREDKLGDCDACPINPSKDPYKSNISIPFTNYYQTHEGRNKNEAARKIHWIPRCAIRI